MVPVFAAKTGILKSLDKPVDFGKSYNGVRIFGDHKTIRGFVSGVIVAVVVALIQNQVSLPDIVPPEIQYSDFNPSILGTLMGLGTLGGDAVKSYFKRRTGIPAGKSWMPFDQVDFIIGASILTYFYIPLSTLQYMAALLIFFSLHIVSTHIGFFLGLKKDPY